MYKRQHIVKRLAEQGLVERVPNPQDGRGTLAAITPTGRDAVARATAALIGEGFALNALSGPERVELFRPVSYTHLDVYKRQVAPRRRARQPGAREPILSGWGSSRFWV